MCIKSWYRLKEILHRGKKIASVYEFNMFIASASFSVIATYSTYNPDGSTDLHGYKSKGS